MADQPTLAVPLHLDVLVANQSVLGRDTFRWWQFNYQALKHGKSPQPMAFDRSEGGPGPGVHLSWTLPDALRHSPADQPHGKFPLVPNRWLIVRIHEAGARKAAAWVLESDCPVTSAAATADTEHTSQYLPTPETITAWKNSTHPVRKATSLDPGTGTVQVARLGVPFPLADWSERASDVPLFLTALAPGNPLFAGYVPHHAGVFSFHDPLTGIDSAQLSYCVIGWYSNPKQDILADGATDGAALTKVLKHLDWALPDGTTTAPTGRSVFHGASFAVDWNRDGPAPAGDPLQTIRDNGKLNVGIGNTATDAFAALTAPQIDDPAKSRLLRAFQHNLLPLLNEPGGDALLDQAIRRGWYHARPGGHSWTITEKSSQGDTGTTLTPAEKQWLNDLNKDQADLDQALATLHSLQERVHGLWFKKGQLSVPENRWPAPPHGVGDLDAFGTRLDEELDPKRPGSAAAQLVGQFAAIQALLPKVPRPGRDSGNAQAAWRKGIADFAATKNLDLGKTLKPVAAPRYWQGNNPVIALAGVEPPPAATRTRGLRVRPEGSLITEFRPNTTSSIGTTQVQGQLDLIGDLSNIPIGAVQPLLREFLLLNLANAAKTPDGPYTGVRPAIPLTPWQQPWAPLFLEWSGTYTHIPLTEGTTRNWTFDGTDYHLTNLPARTKQRTVEGITLLSPHTRTHFRSRLDMFVRQYGAKSDLAGIDELLTKTDDWKFLTQELTGFHQLLALRDTRPFREPASSETLGTHPLAQLLGHSDSPGLPAYAQGRADASPLLPDGPALPFHGTVHGGFHFTDLRIYDAFGRSLDIMESGPSSGVLDETNFPVRIDTALTSDRPIDPQIASMIQLPPRVLQHARLDIRLLDAHDTTKVYQRDPDVTPIAGWILPNHLDNSILLYAPDGSALGEYRLYAGTSTAERGRWTPPPHSRLTLKDVSTRAPAVHDVITARRLATEAGFTAFLDAIDTTLRTTDPLGNRADTHLSLLVGRPLALLRTRLSLQLDGDPLTATGWAATFAPPTADLTNHSFAVRLGDLSNHQDGVIGYFNPAIGYNIFHSTAAAPGPYIRQIGPPGTGDNYLQLTFDRGTHLDATVLADPRAALHAHTGILPVKRYDLPQEHVERALAAMEITFRTGPLMTSVTPTHSGPTNQPEHPNAVAHPTPAEQNGTWTWWEPNRDGTWNGYDLIDTTNTAASGPVPNTLREGVLQLTADLDDTASMKDSPPPPAEEDTSPRNAT
ncbi:hypothetical protein AB0D49_25505 [Streptomyces sp. NPDC048290]|uniref:hypothetical protein n=1 Tax=Streptomyces sp. NPDC048290 TaxID=3155811 RepID=UPI00344320BE